LPLIGWKEDSIESRPPIEVIMNL